MPFLEVDFVVPERVEMVQESSKFFSVSDLNALGGTSLSPGDLRFSTLLSLAVVLPM